MTVIYAPIAFEMTFTPPRSKERTVFVRDVEPVMVREVAGKEAPVAIDAELTPKNGEKARRIEYRSFDGALWEPAPSHEVAVAAPKADDFMGNPFVAPDSPLLGNEIPAHIEIVVINEKKPVSNKRADSAAALQDIADRMLLVDGKLYMQSVGPIIALKLAAGNREGSLVLTSIDDLDKDIIDSMIFRADEKELALRATDGLLGKRAVTVDFEVPAIADPKALNADMTAQAIARTAYRVFMRDADAVGVGNLPSPYLRMFIRYKKERLANAPASQELVDMAVQAGEMIKDVRECGLASKTAAWLPRRLEAANYAFAASSPSI